MQRFQVFQKILQLLRTQDRNPWAEIYSDERRIYGDLTTTHRWDRQEDSQEQVSTIRQSQARQRKNKWAQNRKCKSTHENNTRLNRKSKT